MSAHSGAQLGVRRNLGQFVLLLATTAFVGAMVGLERSLLPLIGEEDFGLTSKTVVLSFIAAFGVAKALANLSAGAAAQRLSRRRLLISGWAVALPVPLLIAIAPSWGWVVAANLLLGVNQGLCWSSTMIMQLDLAGPRQRGFALGLNEAAGYGGGVAIAALASGLLAGSLAPRTVVAAGGCALACAAFIGVLLLVRDTSPYVALEQGRRDASPGQRESASWRTTFARTAFRDPGSRAICQGGFAAKVVDGLAWGLAPLFLSGHGLSKPQIGVVAGLYPAVWGVSQIVTGLWSDRTQRKPFLIAGMFVQAGGLAVLFGAGASFGGAMLAAVVLGLGVALVYPVLPAAISDRSPPATRAAAIGSYRFIRDTGYAAGALVAGVAADLLGYGAAILIVAGVSAASGLWLALELPGHRARSLEVPAPPEGPACMRVTP